jgi:hypothetical protein
MLRRRKKALDYAQGVNGVTQALFFLISRPALERAADSVIRRAADLDGGQYEILLCAADAEVPFGQW